MKCLERNVYSRKWPLFNEEKVNTLFSYSISVLWGLRRRNSPLSCLREGCLLAESRWHVKAIAISRKTMRTLNAVENTGRWIIPEEDLNKDNERRQISKTHSRQRQARRQRNVGGWKISISEKSIACTRIWQTPGKRHSPGLLKREKWNVRESLSHWYSCGEEEACTRKYFKEEEMLQLAKRNLRMA